MDLKEKKRKRDIQKKIGMFILSGAIGLVFGYSIRGTIRKANADCNTSKMLELELKTVESKNEIDNEYIEEVRHIWGKAPFIIEWYFGTNEFVVYIEKEE